MSSVFLLIYLGPHHWKGGWRVLTQAFHFLGICSGLGGSQRRDSFPSTCRPLGTTRKDHPISRISDLLYLPRAARSPAAPPPRCPPHRSPGPHPRPPRWLRARGTPPGSPPARALRPGAHGLHRPSRPSPSCSPCGGTCRLSRGPLWRSSEPSFPSLGASPGALSGRSDPQAPPGKVMTAGGARGGARGAGRGGGSARPEAGRQVLPVSPTRGISRDAFV